MDESKMTDEATIDSLKEMAIKFSKDSYACRVLANAINMIQGLQNENERLAELEDKIEQGTLIELPCKVGDMVWVIRDYGFHRYVKESVIISNFNILPIKNNRVLPVDNYGVAYSEIFLTREEAEKRLLELQGDKK